MDKYRVIIAECEYEDNEEERRVLEPLGCDIVKLGSRDETLLKAELADADAVLFQWTKMTAPLIDAMKRCKVIAKYATGTDGIDLAAATKKKICVTNVTDFCSEEVSDHTCAMLLALSRGLKLHDTQIRRGNWSYQHARPIPDLRRGVLGVVGFGHISRLVMAKMRPFCGEIWVSSRADAEEIASAGGIKKTFEQVVEGADYLTVHIPGTQENFHRFDRSVFLRMKRGTCFVNVARGAVVCEPDLVDALRAGTISFAALDVFEMEPLSADSPLLMMENVMVSPHAAWYSRTAQRTLQRRAAEQIREVLEGRCPPCLVNRELSADFSRRNTDA